jgi:hypothetical protein
MKRTTQSTALYVALVFLSGVVVGGFAHRLYTLSTVMAGPTSPKPDEFRRKYLDEMRSRLGLSAEQLSKINSILDSTKTRYDEVRAKWDKEAKVKAKPELKAIHEDQIQKIKGLLSETQQAEYDNFRAEREKRRQQNAKPSVSSAN